jgi:superfamily II DNA/RNA helicase
MPQVKRQGALDKFKAGERQILIATDVAARGLDVPLGKFHLTKSTAL